MLPPFDRYVAPARPRSGLWRTILGIVLILALGLALQAGAIALGLGLHRGDRAETLAMLSSGATPASVLVLLASFLPFVVAVVLVTWLLMRRGPGTLWGPDWVPDFLRAVLVLGLATAALLWFGPAGSGPAPVRQVPLGLWLALLPLALLLVAGQTLAEELMFRGFLLQQLAARFPRWPVIWFWLPPVVFGAAHWAPGMGFMSPLAMGYALAFGLVAADLTRRSGNIGTAWGLHFVNNCTAILVFSSQEQLSGLALWHLANPVETLFERPWLALLDLLPLALAWAILSRPAAR
ncbi:CPBP family intramembrane glutamic endopeptidase [Poseidonocella sp. HB161398]|uniref:CPBP family intramembrane glutamic endopeptidase n=1 Tax=Poseidonocella sp. HB161398 TaxID=2320855 RepID=UPI001107F558|nr:type II CAAX endopeptidase family protein [Poseidonocella sp. HB161398]